MAALEKIRKKAVILTIVIGAGLAAFILEEGVRASGSFFNDTTAAKVDGRKIDMQAFQQRVAEVQQQNQDQQRTQDGAVEQQQVLGQMVLENILDNECDQNGVEVAPEELNQLVAANQTAQQIMQAVSEQTQQQVASPAQLDKMIEGNPQQFAQVVSVWREIKEEAETQRKAQKVFAVVQNAVQPNALDLAAMQEDLNNSYQVLYAKKDYSTVTGDQYKPTDAEVQAVYDEFKTMFINPNKSRRVHYIAVDLLPSQGDLQQGKNTVDKAFAALQGANGVEALSQFSEFGNVQEQKITAQQASQIGSSLSDSTFSKFVTGGNVGKAQMHQEGNTYTLYKVTSQQQLTDTVKTQAVTVMGDTKAQNAVEAQLNAGQMPKASDKIRIEANDFALQTSGATDSIKNLIESGKKVIKLGSDPKQGAAFRVITGTTKATFYGVAVASYEIPPSTQTNNAAQDKLNNFINKNKTAAQFAKNAQNAGYFAREVVLSANDAQLMNPKTGQPITNSRKAIKWALTDAKVGEVSNIFTDNSSELIAIAVDESYDGDYLPLTAEYVKTFCTTVAMNRKKAAAMNKQFAGKQNSVAAYAKAFGSQADSTTVTFGYDQVQGINTMAQQDGNLGDGGFIGAVAGAKQGQVKVWAGNNAIYAFQVLKVNKGNMQLTKEQSTMQYQQMVSQRFGIGGQNFASLLFSSVKVVNNTAKFQ